MTISVPSEIYRGAGWAVAVVAGPGNALQVVDFEMIDHPDTAEIEAVIARLKLRPAYLAAKDAADAAREAPDYLSNEATYELRIAGGMLSCTEFVSGMTKKERARAGVNNRWF